MTALTQPLRDEHKDLLPHIELLRTVADDESVASTSTSRRWRMSLKVEPWIRVACLVPLLISLFYDHFHHALLSLVYGLSRNGGYRSVIRR